MRNIASRFLVSKYPIIMSPICIVLFFVHRHCLSSFPKRETIGKYLPRPNKCSQYLHPKTKRQESFFPFIFTKLISIFVIHIVNSLHYTECFRSLGFFTSIFFTIIFEKRQHCINRAVHQTWISNLSSLKLLSCVLCLVSGKMAHNIFGGIAWNCL